MLMVVKNQLKIVLLSVKYNLMREMTNRLTFMTNIVFMVLNNATFIIQWMILFQYKDSIGGYLKNDVFTLWALCASTYGVSHIFFNKAYSLPNLIMNGKLDPFLVQPKNVLLSVITSGSSVSSIGDLLYGYLMIFIFHCDLKSLLLFTYFTITGAIILTASTVIAGCLSFYLVRGDILSDNLVNAFILVSTYPDGIFKGVVRLVLYTVIPVGLADYLPVKVIRSFDFLSLLAVTAFAVLLCAIAFFAFHKGLKHYSSSNLMNART